MELIVALAIASILIWAVTPAFSEYGAKQRLRAATDSLHQDLANARSQAIKRHVSIQNPVGRSLLDEQAQLCAGTGTRRRRAAARSLVRSTSSRR